MAMASYVLKVKIDDISMEQAIKKVEQWLESSKDNKRYRIVTPNPEFLMLAQKDEQFRSILNQSDLNIPDGSGLKLSGKVRNVTTGTDLLQELSKMASEQGFTVGLLGGRKNVADKAKQCLKKLYPELKIVYAISDLQV